MDRKWWLVSLLVLVAAVPPGEASAQEQRVGQSCWVRGERANLELRASPYDSAVVDLDGGAVKVCYSRPRKLGRLMGRLVPFGEPWRLGANEATAVHLPAAGTLAGVSVGPGWYSLNAVPGEREWRIVVNREARRWGIPIEAAVRGNDVGSGVVPVERTGEVVELMTIHLEPRPGPAAELVIEWDRTRVRVPIVVRTPGPAGTEGLGG